MYYVGIDIGSTASKAVVLDEDKHTVLHKRVVPSGWNSKETGEQLLQWIYSQGFIRDQLKIIATVYEPNTKRILLTGTPLSIPNWKLHQIIETNGGAVVCEEMCTGIRYCEALVDETSDTIDGMGLSTSTLSSTTSMTRKDFLWSGQWRKPVFPDEWAWVCLHTCADSAYGGSLLRYLHLVWRCRAAAYDSKTRRWSGHWHRRILWDHQ